MELSLREKFIILVNNDRITKSDAIIYLEGDGYDRLPKVVELYSDGLAPKIVFSGGIRDYSYGSYPFKDIFPKLIDFGIPTSAILHESISQNTREQAVEVIKLAQANNWTKLILVASHYHQFRAYLTFLKVILDKSLKLALYNSPSTTLSWFHNTDWGEPRISLLNAEFERIETYSRLNHLASFSDAIEYQKWKELQL